MNERLFLLDAYALIYRSYYAFIRSPRIDSNGRNTGAVYGFVLTLLDILEKEDPELIAVAFDPPGPIFREKEYPEYKAQREATPEDIKIAVPIIKEILRAFQIPILELAGYEADDLIGSLAYQAEAAGLSVMMVTPDKDYAQLVSEKRKIYRPKQGGGYEIWGPTEVQVKFDIESPDAMVDYLGLVGDTADNIPGCKGIGPKGASKLLREYKSIDGIYAHLDEIKGAVGRNLKENEEICRLSRQLARIAVEAPIELDKEMFRRQAVQIDKLKSLFFDLEFRSLMKRINGSMLEVDLFSNAAPAIATSDAAVDTIQEDLFAQDPAFGLINSIENTPHEYILLDSDEKKQAFINELEQLEAFAFDTETDSLNAIEAKIVGMSFAWQANKAYFWPLPDDEKALSEELKRIVPIMTNEKQMKVGQNIKYDIQVLGNYGIEVRGKLFDTMIAHYLIQPEMRHNMDDMAESYLQYKTISYKEMMGGTAGKEQRSIRDVALEELSQYAAEDADITWQLYLKLLAELKQNGLLDLFNEIEMPLTPILAAMERRGVKLDKEVLQREAEKTQEEIGTLESKIQEYAGREFNVNSPSQVGVVLYDDLKVDAKPKKTKTGNYSTDEKSLEKIKAKHPIVPLILEYRAAKKLLSTYIEPLPALTDENSKLHTSYNQTVAATGRLSSSNPNLQNIPIRTEAGRRLRAAFVADSEQYLFLSADYSQIELRIMAHLSQDEALIKAFEQGLDIHSATASKIFNIALEEVSSEMRRQAKSANFGIIYGISPFGLSENLQISRQEAKNLIDGYFQSYKGVKRYMDESIEEAKRLGYVSTIFGRRRYLPDINSANAIVRGFAERNAINAPIQGSAADIIKKAMIDIEEQIRKRKLRSSMIMQVHDELNFNAHVDEIDELKELVSQGMQAAVPSLRVKLLAEIGVGKSWLDAH